MSRGPGRARANGRSPTRAVRSRSMLSRLRIENLVLIRDAELAFAPGLNVITGETGAGKTILAQAFGLLLGTKGDAGFVGLAGEDAYVEAELEAPPTSSRRTSSSRLPSCGPRERMASYSRGVCSPTGARAPTPGVVGRTEDVAGAAERLVAMSGQFEQRRLARPSYQLDVLDAFAGADQLRRRAELRTAWRELLAARRLHDELTRDAAAAEARLAELGALVEDTRRLRAGSRGGTPRRARAFPARRRARRGRGDRSRRGRPRGRRGRGRRDRRGRAVGGGRRAPRPELSWAGDELRDVELRLREVASALRSFLASLDADPARIEEVEAELERIADAKRRFRCATYEELLDRAAAAAQELESLDGGGDPVAAAAEALAAAEARVGALAAERSEARRPRLSPSLPTSQPSSKASGSGTASSASSSASGPTVPARPEPTRRRS